MTVDNQPEIIMVSGKPYVDVTPTEYTHPLTGRVIPLLLGNERTLMPLENWKKIRG